ncbi:hypothetical protein AB0D08_12050 [Kitasatospora sp. NPDC048540]|uniref:hypothetical protein n=1 Tax=unclassified Kitasatospora TaxID=2633591 RepID=UPI00053A8063|nr:hypothetical protein [Kitasatospora sp. MBT63]
MFNRRRTSTVVAALAALLLSGGAVAATAQAGTNDNNNGVIRRNGVAQSMFFGSSCPSGSFCMFAHTQYDNFHTWAFPTSCNHYTMDYWNAHGSWVNNSGHIIWFRGPGGEIVGHASPGTSSADTDFNPVWSFDMC